MFGFLFGIDVLGKRYERQVYGLIEMLSNVGGLVEVIHVFSIMCTYIFIHNTIEVKTIDVFANSLLDTGGSVGKDLDKASSLSLVRA